MKSTVMDLNQSRISSSLTGKKILITGASGFIGHHLTQYLCRIGCDVHGTSRVARYSKTENLTWWTGSFDHYEKAKKLLKIIKPDIIFHLSGEVTADNNMDYVLPTFHSLLTSTVNILTLAAEQGCERIILTGSSTEPPDTFPFPNSPYSAAKWAAGAYGHLFQKTYGLPVVVVRPFMGYGPGQPFTKLIPYVIHALINGENPKLTNGFWLTDWIFIEDLVEGMLASAIQPNLHGKSIDLGSGHLTSVRSIVLKLVEMINPEAKPLFGMLPDRHQEYTRLADVDYAYLKLKWKARVSLEEGLRRTVDFYKNNLVENPEISVSL